MSPQRKKGRGGAGSKIMAPRSSPATDSPDPLVPLKLIRERRASATQLTSSIKCKQLKAEAPLSRFPAAEQAKAEPARISSSERDQDRVIPVEEARSSNVASSSHQPRNQAVEQACTVPLSQVRPNATEQSKGVAALTTKSSVTEKARASSATRTRVSSVENFRSLIASSRCVPATSGDVSNGTHGSSRRLSTKLRAESRPRSSRASPGTSTSSKCPSERVSNEPSKSSTLALLTRGRLSSTTKEDSRKLAKATTMLPACSENPKVCPSPSEKAPSREPLRNLKNCQREAATETSRLSSTTLPLSFQNARKGNLGDDSQGGVSCTKPGQNRQPAVQHGRLSTGSYNLPFNNTMRYTNDVATAISKVTLKRRNEQNVANEIRVSESVHEMEPSATSHLSTSLHKRLALLEGKVSQLASEIKETREMLANDGYSNSADLLIDIQDKITSIERFMAFKESSKSASNTEKDVNMEDRFQVQPTTDNIGEYRHTLQSFNKDKHLHSSQVPIASEHEFYLKHILLRGSVSAPPKVSGLVYDPQYVEFYPHRISTRNCLPFQEKEIENKISDEVLLESTVDSQSVNPNAGLHDNRISCVMTGEKVSLRKTDALDEMATLNGGKDVPSKSSDVCLRADSTQQIFAQENTAYQHGQYSLEQGACTEGPTLCAEDMKDALECNESPLSDSFPENTENIAPNDVVYFDDDDFVPNQLHPIGDKVATAGWYVCEGESILLAHEDGCCSYYDVANMEEKAVYAAPNEMSSILWNDCWLIRAAGSDGRTNKYIVAATAGNALDCGFCSWDFYSKRLAACHVEKQSTPPMGSSPGSPIQRSLNFSLPSSIRSTMGLPSANRRMLHSERASLTFSATNMGVPDTVLHHPPTAYIAECIESPQWWYRPCGPLMASAASSLKALVLYDVRDGEAIMSWESDHPVSNLDYTSPIQWRDKGKLALAEHQAISIWDVNTMDMQCLQYVKLPGKHISAFYVHNADAECNGGVRQRLSSSDTEAYDGICCTQDDISILDFRVPNGVGISFPVPGQEMQSVYARGDMVFVAGLNKESHECGVQQWSLRKGAPVCAYAFPASNSHYTHLALTQVWGSSRLVMAVNGNGLYIFQGGQGATEDLCDVEEVKDVIGTQDLINPSFDYSNSRVLLISRDRQACWSYWPHLWAMP